MRGVQKRLDPGVTDNQHRRRERADSFQSVVSRRKVVVGGISLAASGFFGSRFVTEAQEKRGAHGPSLIGFKPVSREQARGSWPVISEDYAFQVFHAWGEPIAPGLPEFAHPVTAARQAVQLGAGHDGMHFFPIDGSRRGLLALNHEFAKTQVVIGKQDPTSLDEVRAVQHAHGVSITEIASEEGEWRTVASARARRIHVNTPVTFSGPAAGHELLSTSRAPLLGTLNNCANGNTPWNTYLTCEENFHIYFGADAASDWKPNQGQQRYGLSGTDGSYMWHRHDPRFNLASEEHRGEENRFGWVVEIDPFDPTRVPVKRTALGRFRHEGVAVTEGKDGRVVAYMGDDARHEYIYKFVSSGNWRAMRAGGVSPLDEGQLYVARFNEDGTGNWLPLSREQRGLQEHFKDQAEVLVFARQAADLLEATPMDRPEWAVVAPDGSVYCTLTNNSKREVANAANPNAPNPHGHIVRWKDADDHVGTTFAWNLFIVCADTHETEASFSSPDALWADPEGRLFIATDGGQQEGMNDQLLVADTSTGEVRRLFSSVSDGEITGFAVTPDRRTMFVNIQHPGDGDIANTDFPRIGTSPVPRDATVAIWRKDGRVVGA